MLLTRRPNFTNLYGELSRSRNEFEGLFDQLFHSKGIPTINGVAKPDFVPHLDATEKENEYVLQLEVPGIDEKDIKISIEDDVLCITGEKNKENTEENDEVHLSERYYGSFRREITLPQKANTDKVEANYNKGVLKISIEKKEEEKPKKKVIEIKKIS